MKLVVPIIFTALALQGGSLLADELILVEKALQGDIEAKKELRVLYAQIRLNVLERETKSQPIDPAVKDRLARVND